MNLPQDNTAYVLRTIATMLKAADPAQEKWCDRVLAWCDNRPIPEETLVPNHRITSNWEGETLSVYQNEQLLRRYSGSRGLCFQWAFEFLDGYLPSANPSGV